MFLSVTGEEQGLLGSEYYGQHPIYPLKKTVANLNMDGIKPIEKSNDIVLPVMGKMNLKTMWLMPLKFREGILLRKLIRKPGIISAQIISVLLK